MLPQNAQQLAQASPAEQAVQIARFRQQALVPRSTLDNPVGFPSAPGEAWFMPYFRRMMEMGNIALPYGNNAAVVSASGILKLQKSDPGTLVGQAYTVTGGDSVKDIMTAQVANPAVNLDLVLAPMAFGVLLTISHPFSVTHGAAVKVGLINVTKAITRDFFIQPLNPLKPAKVLILSVADNGGFGALIGGALTARIYAANSGVVAGSTWATAETLNMKDVGNYR